MKKIYLFLLSTLLVVCTAGATVVNVRTCGAVGNGVTDDTQAFITAIAAASTNTGNTGGILYIPAGRYLITQTLVLNRPRGLIIQGEGSMGYCADFWYPYCTQSVLIWGGAAGGTLMQASGAYSCSVRDLAFAGGSTANRAGILFLAVSITGFGNMINHFENLSFSNAATGIQLGQNVSDTCDSDMSFSFVNFGNLDAAVRVKNDQGVDLLFNYSFASNCQKVFELERSGNIMVNNLQCSNCPLVVEVLGGGRTCGTYLFNNVRLESSDGGATSRCQLLRSYPVAGTAMIQFIGFQDVQYLWYENIAAQSIPLCDVGPNSTVVFDTSIFNSYVASSTGSAANPATVILNNCYLDYVSPDNITYLCLTANTYGYYKMTDCRDGAKIWKNRSKWPADADMR